jgi:hypothetical protein
VGTWLRNLWGQEGRRGQGAYLVKFYAGWAGDPTIYLSGPPTGYEACYVPSRALPQAWDAPIAASSALEDHAKPAWKACLLPASPSARPFLLTSALAPPSSSNNHGASTSLGTPRPPASGKAARPRNPHPQGKIDRGPRPGARLSHHRGRWPGRKAEVRKCPAPRLLPFRQKRSRSLRPDFRAVPSMFRTGESEPRHRCPSRKFSC